MTNMETTFIVKNLFDKKFKSSFLESRIDNMYVNFNDRKNYIFNKSIEGIEKSDLIILIGTNPRFEATILNARIRKAYLKNKTKIYSFGDIGDLTYPYEEIQNSTEIINEIVNNKHNLSKMISNSKLHNQLRSQGLRCSRFQDRCIRT